MEEATVVIYNLNDFDNLRIDYYFSTLPTELKGEIKRYKNVSDLKARLISRLIICVELNVRDLTNALKGWEKNSYGKPFLKNWKSFNISHSGDWVAVAFGERALGFDIEKRWEFDFEDVVDLLHEDEQHYINNSSDPNKAFFEVWVKKESFLKAIGIGITSGIDIYNVLEREMHWGGD
jgi:4'-phosphopantetheinyl transferase